MAIPASQLGNDPALAGLRSTRPGVGIPELVQREFGRPVVACQLVTTLLGPTFRRSYRVELEGGRVIKVRQFWSEARASEIEKYLRGLGRRHFPELLSRVGPTLMLEWVDGQTLNSAARTVGVIRECGELLAWVHLMPVEEAEEDGGQLGQMIPRIRARAEALRYWGLLPPSECARLTEQLKRNQPDSVRLSLIHGDFCGENLVTDHRGQIYSIDNESLGRGYPEADLARALLRWNLSGPETEAFLEGYQARRPLREFHRQNQFWSLVSLIKTVSFRYRCRGADYAPALARLKQLLDGPCW